VDDPQRTIFEILTPALDYMGPLEITGQVISALTDNGETDPLVDVLLQDYADSLDVSVEAALRGVLDRQAIMISAMISRLYDEALAPFNAGTGSPQDFPRLVDQYRKDTSAVAGTQIGNVPAFTNYFTPVSNSVNYTVPVFPVSDADGYEVIGSFPYGRGLRIEPGASFGQFLEQDPLRFADRQAVDDYVNSIVRSTDGNPNSEAEERLFASLSNSDPGVTTLLNYASKSSDSTERTDLLRSGLANFQLSSRSTFSKLTVANAAVGLGNILPPEEAARPCACTATDTDIFMESFLNNPDLFATISNPQGRASEWMRKKVNETLDPHALRQSALRGGPVRGEADNLPLYDPAFPPAVDPAAVIRNASALFSQASTNLEEQLRIQRDLTRALPTTQERRHRLNRNES
jgi:hypothetical protein